MVQKNKNYLVAKTFFTDQLLLKIFLFFVNFLCLKLKRNEIVPD